MTTVLVASGGGHLQQLHLLLPRLSLLDEVIWATPVSGLSEDLLRDQLHFELPYLPPRDWRGASRLLKTARGFLKQCEAERIISTGSSPAPPFFLAGASLGLELHYIESATRSRGPSLSGTLVSLVPQANLYTQYPSWARGRWSFAGSIFDGYTVQRMPKRQGPLRRVVVTFGTEKFGFRRAVERLIDVLPSGVDVLWQTGSTDVSGLGIDARETVANDELRDAIRVADVVVCHAGTGSAVTAFDLGKTPVLLPRESRYMEHVDDHQLLTASELQRRGLVVSVRVSELTLDDFRAAMTGRVTKDCVVRPFELKHSAPAHRLAKRRDLS